MNKFMGIEYGRGCLATAIDGGCALATAVVQKMFPSADWTVVTADLFNPAECTKDRFGENFKIQEKIYNQTPTERHILIGGDHSINFGHFLAISDQMPDQDLCLVYLDAHLDMHTPQSSAAEASGAPHGTNVRALLGDGDSRWLGMTSKRPVLKPENLFYLGTRSYEPTEINFVKDNNIFYRTTDQLMTPEDWAQAVATIRERIGGRPFVVSLDFDCMDPSVFKDVLVPAPNGISACAAAFLVNAFRDAHSFEFVEYAPTGDTDTASVVKELVGIVTDAN